MAKVTANKDQEARDMAHDALSRAKAHEDLCTERWSNQTASMLRVEQAIDSIRSAMEDRIGRLPAGIIAALTGLVGFLAARVWH